MSSLLELNQDSVLEAPNAGASRLGFTLAELLIAVTILGVIVTLLLLKVLQGSDASRYNAVVKEAATALTEAYVRYKQENAVTASTSSDDILRNYLNYIEVDTVSSINAGSGTVTVQCGQNGDTCYRLANGALVMSNGCQFSTSGPTGAVRIRVDPSGRADNVLSVVFWLFTTGRLVTEASRPASPGIVSSGTCNPTWAPGVDAPYFSWR